MSQETLIADLSQSITNWHKKAQQIWPALTNWNRPVFSTNELKGGTAGKAFFTENKIKVNWELYLRNKDKFLRNTVGHEIAHLAAAKIHGMVAWNHGPLWKEVMVKLGLPPERCHSYDVEGIKQTKTIRRMLYMCQNKHELWLTPNKHTVSSRLICAKCRTKIVFMGKVKEM